MKIKYFNINKWTSLFTLGIMLMTLFLTSCEDDNDYSGPITITKVYLEDAESSVPDREVSFVRLGQLIRIEGTGFSGVKKVYINGYDSYFNPTLVSDQSMLVSVSKETPIIEADAEVRNTIRLVNDGNQAILSFEVRAASPSITGFSNSLPNVGEPIIVYGSGLLEVSSVLFPGDVQVTDGIVSNEEGEYFVVTMPDGVSELGGSIFIECANGGAYSPAYFNFKAGVILNFDGQGGQGSWGSATSMIKPEDLESVSIGTDNVSQGIYVPHRPSRISSIAAASTRCSEVWTEGNIVKDEETGEIISGDQWRNQLTPYIPTTTSLDKVAFQFDIYVPDEWEGTGFLKICLVNGFNGGEWAGYCYNYVPWIVDGESAPFQTTGWTTVTVPFSSFYAFDDGEDHTFEEVLVARETSSYKNFGFYFENSDFALNKVTGKDSDSETEFVSSETSINVYTDNWRVVPLNTPVYSDYPEDEE